MKFICFEKTSPEGTLKIEISPFLGLLLVGPNNWEWAAAILSKLPV